MKTRLAERTLLAVVDGEAVILNTDSERYYGLNSTAQQMLLALTESASDAAARDLLLQRFATDEATLTRDIAALIARLSALGIVERVADE